MTTHIGKIGRLSKDCRQELGQRLEDGQPGTEIVLWLNNQPDVQKILNKHFAGRPITEQNLSDWKQSGHLDWLRRQEAREAARRITEQAEELDQAVPDSLLSEEFSTVFASEMTRLAMALLEQETDPEKKWKRLCEIHRELSRLRRDDHRALRAYIAHQRWDGELVRAEVEEAQREKAAHKERLTEILLAGRERGFNAKLFGGGEVGRHQAEMLYRIRCDLPLKDLLDGTWDKQAGPVKEPPKPEAEAPKTPANSPKSCLIQANPVEKATLDPVEAKPVKPDCSKKRKASLKRKEVQPSTEDQPAEPVDESGFSPAVSGQLRGAESIWQAEGDTRAGSKLDGPSPRSKRRRALPIRHSLAAPKQSEGGEFVIDPINPLPPLIPTATPPAETQAPNPEQAAYNCWFRMNRGFEPFDHEKLQKLYAAIPPKETRTLKNPCPSTSICG